MRPERQSPSSDLMKKVALFLKEKRLFCAFSPAIFL